MKISVRSGDYKSICMPLEWDNVPEFAILTGENGGGKSNLLFAINQTLVPERNSKGGTPIGDLNIKIEGFSCKPAEVIYSTDLSGRIDGGHTSLYDISRFVEEIKNRQPTLNSPLDNERDRLVKELVKSNSDGLSSKVQNIVKYEPWLFYGNPKILATSVSQHFLNFWIDCFQYIVNGGDRDGLLTNFGKPPWEELNELFEFLDLPYTVTNPSELDVRQPFELRLLDKRIDRYLTLAELSSGESTLMRLILLLFSNEKYKIRPKIFLLDEPDAHLHAYLIHAFVNAIQEIIVRRYSCRVLMVSHRVETMSYAPVDSIFTMQRQIPRIFKSRDENQAIAILSKNFLTVAKGQCVIYVEDQSDADFYAECLNICCKNHFWPLDIIPSFIASGIGAAGLSGGKQVVKTWVARLRRAGLKNVWGLIDKDESNEPNGEIKVIPRYSKENFQFDPIFVYAALLDQGIIPQDHLPCGQSMNRSTRLENLSNNVLQECIDFITGSVEDSEGMNLDDKARLLIDSASLGGFKFKVPYWVITMRGHDLANMMYKTWKGATRKDVERAFYRHPVFWPAELRDTLLLIASANLEI